MQMKLCWHSMLAHQCLPLPVRVSEYRQPFSCAYCDFTKLIHIESSKWYGISYLRLHPCRLPLRQETRQVPTLTVQHRGRLPRQRLRLEGALPGLSPVASPRQVPATQQEKTVQEGHMGGMQKTKRLSQRGSVSRSVLFLSAYYSSAAAGIQQNDIEYWISVKAAAWFCPPSLTCP